VKKKLGIPFPLAFPFKKNEAAHVVDEVRHSDFAPEDLNDEAGAAVVCAGGRPRGPSASS
jgi:hypothetical protein